jgi:hypothetical protein
MSDEAVHAAWCAAVAKAALDEVVAVSRCSFHARPASQYVKGQLHMGRWAALVVPDSLLGTEFDPDSDELIHVRYSDYRDLVCGGRWLVPTTQIRFSRQLTIVGPRKAMATLHALWVEDRAFESSIDESWA